MATVKIRINGSEYTADNSRTILQVARDNGIAIPTLCHDPRLPPYGSCLVCVVEARHMNRLIMSCTQPVAEGMDIWTHSPQAVSARKAALEMLLSNHWADCRGPCYVKCPANVDVQGYLAYANAGMYNEALELIRETNPMPLVCGRICVRHCETACRRKDVDSPVAINFMKRYVTDLEYDRLPAPVVAPKNGKKVAIVGGGPAGLTCAYFLAKNGYSPVIFDKQPKLGGMLRYGIPEYRLPEKVLDKEINYLLAHGIEVKAGAKLGREFTLDSLKKEGFDATFLSIGSWVAKGMGIENEKHKNILPGIAFLEECKLSKPPSLSGTAVVVGGGNTAVDAARTAVRCGASKVAILYRRTRTEMPADEMEVEDAIAEGVDVQFLVAPKKAVIEDGRLTGLECYRMELGEPDASGRRRPVQVKGSEFVFKCDYIISAIGQDQDLSGLKNDTIGEIKQTKWKSIEADPATFMTSIAGVFSGGDCMTGPSAAIDAIGAGRKAAWVMDRYIRTGTVQKFPEEFVSRRDILEKPGADFFEGIARAPRAGMGKTDASCRAKEWEEVDTGVTKEVVAAETLRCLSCGCKTVFDCDLKDLSTEVGARQDRFKGRIKKHKVDERHPFITLDSNKCILCGRCVRYCGELIGVHAMGFINRGYDTVVKPTLDKPLAETPCISCGNCIEVCPTGAIEFRYGAEKPGPFRTVAHKSVCSFCGVGCRLEINEAGRNLAFVTAEPASPHTAGELCVKGRFANMYLTDRDRISQCRVKGKGAVKMDEAAAASVAGLNAVVARHGAKSVLFLLSPRLSCKELLIAGNVAGSFGGARVASVEDIVRGAAPLGLASARQDAVDGADVIVTIGTGVLNYNPVLGFRVKRAAKAGAKLVHIGMASPDMKKYAKTIIPAGKTGEAGVLSALCGVIVQKGLCDRGKISMLKEGVTFLKTRFEEAGGVTGAALEQLAAELCDHSKKVVFIINEDQMLTARPDLKWAHDTLMLAGRSDSLIVVRNESNSRGMQDVVYGMLGHGPEVAKTAEAVKSGAIRAVVSIGQDPSALKGLEGVEFSVAVDMFETAFSQSADVVVPLSAIFESLGASISFDGRMVRYEPAMAPAHGFDNTAFLGAMLSATGAKVPTHEELRDSFVAANPAYSEFMKTGALLSYSDAGWRPGRFLCEKAAAVDAGSVYRSATTWSKVWEKKVR